MCVCVSQCFDDDGEDSDFRKACRLSLLGTPHSLTVAVVVAAVITAELGSSLAVVKVTSQVNGNAKFWGSMSPVADSEKT